jgi:hypothetical protein
MVWPTDGTSRPLKRAEVESAASREELFFAATMKSTERSAGQ